MIVTFRRGVITRSTNTHTEIIAGGHTEAVAILSADATVTIICTFTRNIAVVCALVLQCEIQAVNQTEEAGVTVSCYAVGTANHEVVSGSITIATELWQHIGP